MEERTEVDAIVTPDATGAGGPAKVTRPDVATLIWTTCVGLAVLLAITAAIASFVVWTDYQPEDCTPGATTGCGVGDGASRASDFRLAAVSGAVLLGLILATWSIVRAVRTRSGRDVGAAVTALLASTLGIITGALGTMLAWDQLGLRQVEVVPPGRFRGLGFFFDDRADSIRFVLVAGAEVGVDTIRRWIVLTAGSAVGAFALLAIALFLLRPTPSRPGLPDPTS